MTDFMSVMYHPHPYLPPLRGKEIKSGMTDMGWLLDDGDAVDADDDTVGLL